MANNKILKFVVMFYNISSLIIIIVFCIILINNKY